MRTRLFLAGPIKVFKLCTASISISSEISVEESLPAVVIAPADSFPIASSRQPALTFERQVVGQQVRLSLMD